MYNIIAMFGWLMMEYSTNFLLTEHEGRTGEYWPEVVAVRANIPQYGSSKLG